MGAPLPFQGIIVSPLWKGGRRHVTAESQSGNSDVCGSSFFRLETATATTGWWFFLRPFLFFIALEDDFWLLRRNPP